MTLPATGTITMDMVRFELDRESSAISLNDADVRTLASKPSGLITMYDLYGKQFYSPHRAQNWTGYTNWTETTGASAKDTTGTTVDSSTEAGTFDSPAMSGSGGITNAVEYYVFGNTKSYTGTLTVRWYGYTQYNTMFDEEYGWTNIASSSVTIEYSLDNGSTWTYLSGISGGGSYASLQNSTASVVCPHLSNVRVRISFQSQDVGFNGSPFYHAQAAFGVWVSDILIY